MIRVLVLFAVVFVVMYVRARCRQMEAARQLIENSLRKHGVTRPVPLLPRYFTPVTSLEIQGMEEDLVNLGKGVAFMGYCETVAEAEDAERQLTAMYNAARSFRFPVRPSLGDYIQPFLRSAQPRTTIPVL